MQAALCFTELLELAANAERQLKGDGVLSLALPVEGLDPLLHLPQLGDENCFKFLWDRAPGLSLAASGRTNHLELSGPRRFQLAQRFADLSLSRLVCAPQSVPPQARPRVLLAFSFFDAALQNGENLPGIQAVLPRWQLSRQGHEGWLRLQVNAGNGTIARQLAEELWLKAESLVAFSKIAKTTRKHEKPSIINVIQSSSWQESYIKAAKRGLELVNQHELHKLVIAVRQNLLLEQPLKPLDLLYRLRKEQSGSCRFLWQVHKADAFFGASPERLLVFRQGQLLSDALAGTASVDDVENQLLKSDKDRHEHELVVEEIIKVLCQQGMCPSHPNRPRLARHGHLIHLHTPIIAKINGQSPLLLAEALHPTPAVAGLPRREAMAWLRSLEEFERGHYAAPIGWIDNSGDAELRVAIRSARQQNCHLEITAGAGLVCGSILEKELQEVNLKLGVMHKQLNLPIKKSQLTSNFLTA
uniref:isochorismate synthase n=1 Tax=Paulinella chromatophora TaxID=39717 RepID=B1X4B0_PAUCH|nr:Isochorismate synthase [Paulinella chromatophora]ACB42779.1 Isochorismate synthase [Paulinella chromatophora]|eukprot:gb/GEZN01001704.1/.p1 GENE.gb/GEZN01001704.1/~~gb/GEZN01001704.1/.p1  ORF type:complete len:472 (-),score=-11.26 gb/GEZN01001704.1/:254-1669(-)